MLERRKKIKRKIKMDFDNSVLTEDLTPLYKNDKKEV